MLFPLYSVFEAFHHDYSVEMQYVELRRINVKTAKNNTKSNYYVEQKGSTAPQKFVVFLSHVDFAKLPLCALSGLCDLIFTRQDEILLIAVGKLGRCSKGERIQHWDKEVL